MPLSLRYVQCLTRPAIHVWCKKKFARGRESVADEEEPGRCAVSTIAAVDSLMRSNRRVMG